MPITLQFAQRVLKLRTLSDIAMAVALQCQPGDVAEARRMLALPAVDDELEVPLPLPTEAQRRANWERMPKAWQDRNRRD
jgi:hypothetical protein